MGSQTPAVEASQARKRLLITVHGIRTFGAWQEKLSSKLDAEVDEPIASCHYRYGFFSIIAFLIPPLRWVITRRFQSDLLHQAAREPWSRIDIVAHSFGTHLVAWAMLHLDRNRRPRIHTVILAGSVLKSSFPIRELVGTSVTRLVNDCGIRDSILVLNQLLVLFTGMAGRVGIGGMESAAFRNRYFEFGHSGYFADGQAGEADFISRYWIPLLRSQEGIPAHDERQISPFQDLTTTLLNNIEPIKLICYVVPLLLALGYVNQLRLNAEREANIALSRQFAITSELLRSQILDPQPAALLATEAIERDPYGGNDRAVRDTTAILPRIAWQLAWTTSARVLQLDSDSGLLLVATGQVGHIIDVKSGEEKSHFFLNEPITRAVFSPGGEIVVAAGPHKAAQVFDTAGGKQLTQLGGTEGGITSIAFSRGGRLVGAAYADKSVRLFDPVSGTLLRLLRTSDQDLINAGSLDRINAIDFDPSGRYLMAASEYNVHIFDTTSGQQIAVLPHNSIVDGAVFSPDGSYLFTASDDYTIRVFESLTGKVLSEFRQSFPVSGLAVTVLHPPVPTTRDKPNRLFDEKGRELRLLHDLTFERVTALTDVYIAVAAGERTMLLQAKDGKEVWHADERGNILETTFSADGAFLATRSDDRTVRVFETVSGKEVARVVLPQLINSIKLSADGGEFAVGCNDRVIRLFNTRGTNATRVLTGQGMIRAVAFSADGKYLITGGRDWTARVFDTRSGKQVHMLVEQDPVGAVAFSNVDTYVATGSDDGVMRVTDLASQKEVFHASHELDEKLAIRSNSINALAFSSDGRFLASGEDHLARLFDVRNRKEIARVPSATEVLAVALSADHRLFATGDRDSNAIVVNLATGKEWRRFNHDGWVQAVSFSSDGRYLATGSWDKTARVFDLATGNELSRISHEDLVWTVNFSPDGRMIATGSGDSTARVFDAVTGAEISEVGLRGPVWGARFVEGRDLLLTSSVDQADIILNRTDLRASVLIDDACSRLTRNLTKAEWNQYLGPTVPYHETCRIALPRTANPW